MSNGCENQVPHVRLSFPSSILLCTGRLCKRDGFPGATDDSDDPYGYNAGFRWYSAAFNSTMIQMLEKRDDVDYIQEDLPVSIFRTQDAPPSWVC